jgi:transcriptional regulator with XRE-family HTH domain
MDTEDLLKVSAVRRLVAARKLREQREALRLSVREMAAAIPASPAALCRWEQGETVPRAAACLRLAKLLDISAAAKEAA